MPLMEWNDNLSVEVGLFDDQHKTLVGMVNELFDAMKENKAKEVLGDVLKRLIAYTATHFADEERAMASVNYPGLADHKKEHEALVKQVLEVQKKFDSGATQTLTMEVMNFLKNWLVKHIQGTDKKYAVALRDTKLGRGAA